jgi:hypothetical protein
MPPPQLAAARVSPHRPTPPTGNLSHFTCFRDAACPDQVKHASRRRHTSTYVVPPFCLRASVCTGSIKPRRLPDFVELALPPKNRAWEPAQQEFLRVLRRLRRGHGGARARGREGEHVASGRLIFKSLSSSRLDSSRSH